MAGDPIHPGEFLADELEEIEMTTTGPPRQIGVPPDRISRIVRCKRDGTADTALRLAQFLGTGPEPWPNLEEAYDPDKAKAALGIQIRKIHRGSLEGREVHPAR